MSVTERQQPQTRLIAVASIDIPLNRREPSQANVEWIAQSIQLQGLLQPIGVRQDGDRLTLLFGGNRLAAHKKLERDEIEARILDISVEDGVAVMHAENLFRSELDPKARFNALAEWSAHFKLAHPEASGAKAKGQRRAPKVRVETAVEPDVVGEVEAASEELIGLESTSDLTPSPSGVLSKPKRIPPPGKPAVACEPESVEPPTAVKVLSRLTGKSKRTSSKEMAIAEKLTEDQRSALIDRKVGSERMATIALLRDEAKTRAVNLITSGTDFELAIMMAKLPANATIVSVNNSNAEWYKPEEEMTDEEWLEMYCGDTLHRLTYKDSYRAAAFLYKATRAARTEFRNKTKKTLSQFKKSGTKSPFYFLFNRMVYIAHPKDWLICGPCGGRGRNVDECKCETCHGHGFAITSEVA